MSSAFRHDENAKHVVTNKESKFVNLHGKIYELDSGETELVFDQEHQLLNASIPLDFSITINVASMLIGLVFLLLVFIISGFKAKKNKGAPSGMLSFLEPIVLFVRDDIVKPNIGKHYNKFLPYLLTLFFFILINNLLGLLPGSANVTGNIAITLVLSCITLIVTNLSGNKSYWGHIFNPPGVPLALMPIMIPIELVGIFTKPFGRAYYYFKFNIINIHGTKWVRKHCCMGSFSSCSNFCSFYGFNRSISSIFTSLYFYITNLPFYWVSYCRTSLKYCLT